MKKLIENLDKLHTTELGKIRILRNLEIENTDVVGYCKTIIKDPLSTITEKGKNFYISKADITLTVNKHSYTIITAHKKK
ncbi:hypothetical protein BN85403340 [Alteracholeplasma palmae J233]|uniref:DUF3781 domain-containing protein n=1 Tax=Alteracholeplasma palmae (strain ATCC 49389 / J233) TaxID=1318466 RepID=U4KR69_ALTPJ|nr:DUF3781 domain-containing protein [Alteracholeplasma palmae]CCV63911.1 hypothetical protein BN85403340 [Alteracholeplasma palmae J233]